MEVTDRRFLFHCYRKPSFKFFPAYGLGQGPIGLTLELCPQIALSEIATIRMRAYRSAVSHAVTVPQALI